MIGDQHHILTIKVGSITKVAVTGPHWNTTYGLNKTS